MTTYILLTETDFVYLAYFLKETQGLAIPDSGCSKTVCGQSWLRPYGETLSVHDRQLVSETQYTMQYKFRFGDGATYSALHCVTFPNYIHGKGHFLSPDVVIRKLYLMLSEK